MPDVFLTIVTDNPDEAIADTLCCAMTDKPKWARVVSDPLDILAIADGSRCIGIWYSGRKRPSGAEIAWRDRRLAGGLTFIDEEAQARIDGWIGRHKAKMRGEAAAPAAASPEARQSILPHPQPEIRDLVLTQRWT